MAGMTTSSGVEQGQGRRRRTILAIAVAILLLALLYLIQVMIARGPLTHREQWEIFVRSAIEWLGWAVLLSPILRLATFAPVGPGQPRRNWLIQGAGCVVGVLAWSAIVAVPISLLQLPLWGWRPSAGWLVTAESALLQRGPHLAIIYGLIVSFGVARSLSIEQEAAAVRTEELRRELAAAELDQFTRLMGSERLLERLGEVEVAMARSPDEAETATLELAQELHESLARSRSALKS